MEREGATARGRFEEFRDEYLRLFPGSGLSQLATAWRLEEEHRARTGLTALPAEVLAHVASHAGRQALGAFSTVGRTARGEGEQLAGVAHEALRARHCSDPVSRAELEAYVRARVRAEMRSISFATLRYVGGSIELVHAEFSVKPPKDVAPLLGRKGAKVPPEDASWTYSVQFSTENELKRLRSATRYHAAHSREEATTYLVKALLARAYPTPEEPLLADLATMRGVFWRRAACVGETRKEEMDWLVARVDEVLGRAPRDVRARHRYLALVEATLELGSTDGAWLDPGAWFTEWRVHPLVVP